MSPCDNCNRPTILGTIVTVHGETTQCGSCRGFCEECGETIEQGGPHALCADCRIAAAWHRDPRPGVAR